jgi:diaminopimelate epimerase
MSLNFHKYHALGNDYIVIDPNKTNAKLSAHPVKTGQARLELQSHSLNIKPTPIRFTEWS